MADSTGLLAELLEAGLARHGRARSATAPVDVQPLGLRDAFRSEEKPSASAVPVRYYGRHAVIGPLPASADTRQLPCARCLERRWQAVRSVALREALE
ncbi:bacteriocin biosynthesis protein SagD, partial [Streptomyces sp. SID2119]|nr:bacteriocin biosynthesis protein SagD [Streptomyces sp. SID2119]